jgi:hypothetical protein
MTDISINKFRTAITRGGATPSTPGFAETEGQDPVNPNSGGTQYGIGAGLSLDSTNRIQLGNDGAGVIDISDTDVFGTGVQFNFQKTDLINDEDIFSQIKLEESEFVIQTIFQKPVLGTSFSTSLEIQSSDDRALFNFTKGVNGQGQSLVFESVGNLIKLTDQINSKGLEYASDYEANFTARSLVTKQYVDGAVSGGAISIGSPANGLSLAGTVLSLGLASSGVTGALSGTDWNTFNGKIGGSGVLNELAFFSGSSTITSSPRIIWDGVNSLSIGSTLAFKIRSAGSQTFVSSTTGLFYLRPLGDTDATNQILLSSAGIAINATSATAMLDVNGTTRIRTISNLGSTATRFLVASATGVVSERTGAELAADIGATNLWTVDGTGIIRNSLVAIGRTTVQASNQLTIRQQTNDDTSISLRCERLDGTLRFEVRNSYSLFQTEVAIQGHTTGSNALRVRQRTNDDTVDSLRCENLAGTARFQVKNTFSQFTQDVAIFGVGSLNALLVRASTGVIFRGQNSSSVDQCTISNTGVFSGGIIITGTRNLTIGEGNNIILGTTTGTKIGTATNQLLGFWNATPIVQPTTAVAAATRVHNSSTAIHTDDTFDGYTLAQIVKALRNTGLLQ